jgi:hypothetical protein
MSGFKEKGPINLTDLVGWGHVGDYLPPPQVQLELVAFSGESAKSAREAMSDVGAGHRRRLRGQQHKRT